MGHLVRVMVKTFAGDVDYLQACLQELETYLLSDELFWTLGAAPTDMSGAFPRLTLGGVLLALVRAIARSSTRQEEVTVEKLESRVEEINTKWRVAWERKAEWEFRSRLRQWGNFLNEFQNEPAEQVSYYAYEVRLRVMLELLSPHAEGIEGEYLDLLNALDQVVGARFAPGEFLWEADLKTGFPPEPYWYLWGQLVV